jgi:hypothetical protein
LAGPRALTIAYLGAVVRITLFLLGLLRMFAFLIAR